MASTVRTKNPRYEYQKHLVFGNSVRLALLEWPSTRRIGGSFENGIHHGIHGDGEEFACSSVEAARRRRSRLLLLRKVRLERASSPYTAFVMAFSDLITQILEKRKGDAAVCRTTFELALEEPSARTWFPAAPNCSTIRILRLSQPILLRQKRKNRLKFLFRMFVRAVCSGGRPLVLVLDDMQWADSPSLELAESLVTDPENPSFLLVTTCRNNDVDEEHPFLAKLRCFQAAGVQVKTIMLGDLDLDAVNTIVSVALRMSAGVTRPLSELIFAKTRGNPFLYENSSRRLSTMIYLTFNFGLLRWRWDLERVRSRLVTGNVADLVSGRLRRLPEHVLLLLQVCGRLGQSFDDDTLVLSRPSL